MNILYVTIIMAVTFTLVSNLENAILGNHKMKQRLEDRAADVMLAKEIAEIAANSIDRFVLNSNCGGGRMRISLGDGQEACWPNDAGSAAGFPCFAVKSMVKPNGQQTRLCLITPFAANLLNDWSNRIAKRTLEGTLESPFCQLLGCYPKSSLAAPRAPGTPGYESSFSTYTMMDQKQNPSGTGDADSIGFNSFPPSNSVNSNGINCSTNYTECYTLAFCVGGTGCALQDRIQFTVAVRRF